MAPYIIIQQTAWFSAYHAYNVLLSYLIIVVAISYDCILRREEVEDLAKQLKLKLFRTSVKEDFNVNEGRSDVVMMVYLCKFI